MDKEQKLYLKELRAYARGRLDKAKEISYKRLKNTLKRKAQGDK